MSACIGCMRTYDTPGQYGDVWPSAVDPELCEACARVINRKHRSLADPDCPWCERLCSKCRYPIDSGWVHVQQPQPSGASHVVCMLVRNPPGPLVEVLGRYLDHAKHGRPVLVSPEL